ncbi:hypothetical protein Vwe01_61490 [Micromonospora andamanensis]|nr:hypothetical protein Vwe01_61490 [Micromonospora andamanensis]
MAAAPACPKESHEFVCARSASPGLVLHLAVHTAYSPGKAQNPFLSASAGSPLAEERCPARYISEFASTPPDFRIAGLVSPSILISCPQPDDPPVGSGGWLRDHYGRRRRLYQVKQGPSQPKAVILPEAVNKKTSLVVRDWWLYLLQESLALLQPLVGTLRFIVF